VSGGTNRDADQASAVDQNTPARPPVAQPPSPGVFQEEVSPVGHSALCRIRCTLLHHPHGHVEQVPAPWGGWGGESLSTSISAAGGQSVEWDGEQYVNWVQDLGATLSRHAGECVGGCTDVGSLVAVAGASSGRNLWAMAA